MTENSNLVILQAILKATESFKDVIEAEIRKLKNREQADRLKASYGIEIGDPLMVTQAFLDENSDHRGHFYKVGEVVILSGIDEVWDGDKKVLGDCRVDQLDGGSIGGTPLSIIVDMRKEYLSKPIPPDDRIPMVREQMRLRYFKEYSED